MRTQRWLVLMAAAALSSAMAWGGAGGQGSGQQERARARECPGEATLKREVAALRARLSALEGQGEPRVTEMEASRRSRRLTGTVDTLEGEVVWLRDAQGNLLRVVVDEDTRSRQDGRPISSDSLAPGMNVRARTEVRGGEQVAEEVEVLSAPAR